MRAQYFLSYPVIQEPGLAPPATFSAECIITDGTFSSLWGIPFFLYIKTGVKNVFTRTIGGPMSRTLKISWDFWDLLNRCIYLTPLNVISIQ